MFSKDRPNGMAIAGTAIMNVIAHPNTYAEASPGLLAESWLRIPEEDAEQWDQGEIPLIFRRPGRYLVPQITGARGQPVGPNKNEIVPLRLRSQLHYSRVIRPTSVTAMFLPGVAKLALLMASPYE